MTDPNDLIDGIMRCINEAEILHDPSRLIEARRLLNNDLRQAIDRWIAAAAQPQPDPFSAG
jgi:hypothetical protein